MTINESFNVIGDFVKFTYVENPGIAFGIRVGNGMLFTVLSILASLGVLVYLITHWDEPMGIKGSLALILGGACGNLIDRIFYRQVVDFIDVGIGHVRWPVFNLADSAVVIGMFILFYTVFIQGKKLEKVQQAGVQEVD
jgi:signal peptidase II